MSGKNMCIFILVLLISNFLYPAMGETPHTASLSQKTVDVDLPYSNGTIAVRIYVPSRPRYPDGAPVIIYVPGGDSRGSLQNAFPKESDDMAIIYFLFPGGVDMKSGRRTDGVYDYRGMGCIEVLKTVILYAAGKVSDTSGNKIDDVLPVPVLHDNIGLIGASNGGNIVIATPALYGEEMRGNLRYVIQWESPVSSQIATVDLGPIKHNCSPNEFVNPRYISYDPLVLKVDFSDLFYNPSEPVYKVFHDGNGDGRYTTVISPETGLPTPDLNLNGILELDEDFPLSSYTDGIKSIYSRPVTHALKENGVISTWPPDIATPEEADEFWDIREAVRLYGDALKNIPDLRGMILANVKDHVQAAPDKPHIHQAFDGWNRSGAWVKINPEPSYLIEVDPSLAGREDLPDNAANVPPSNWSVYDYCVPEDISADIYQLAGIHEMADRVYYNRWYSLGIEDVKGGFGVKVTVKNKGVVEAENISWSIDVRGMVLAGRHWEGEIASLPPGESAVINVGPIAGIGPGEIIIRIGEEIRRFDCFLLWLLILI